MKNYSINEAVISRRRFFGLAGLTALSVAEVNYLFTCNPTDIWHEVEAWVPVGIDAFDEIVSLVLPLESPAIEGIAAMVKAGFSAVAAAVDGYLGAPASEKATWKQKLLLALTELGDNIQGFLTAIEQSNSPVLKIIVALITVLVDAISGFSNTITGTSTNFRAEFHVAGTIITVKPVLMNRATFISNFNAACDQFPGGASWHIPNANLKPSPSKP
jgi:hypothetical protein